MRFEVLETAIGDGTRGTNFNEIQEWLGKRPGDYKIDPYYLRTGMAGKPYFYDVKKKGWRRVSKGDRFFINDDGIPEMEKANG